MHAVHISHVLMRAYYVQLVSECECSSRIGRSQYFDKTARLLAQVFSMAGWPEGVIPKTHDGRKTSLYTSDQNLRNRKRPKHCLLTSGYSIPLPRAWPIAPVVASRHLYLWDGDFLNLFMAFKSISRHILRGRKTHKVCPLASYLKRGYRHTSLQEALPSWSQDSACLLIVRQEHSTHLARSLRSISHSSNDCFSMVG